MFAVSEGVEKQQGFVNEKLHLFFALTEKNSCEWLRCLINAAKAL